MTTSIYEVELELPGDDNIQNIARAAERLSSFQRVRVAKQGGLSQAAGICFIVTVFLTNPAEATFFKLKWG